MTSLILANLTLEDFTRFHAAQISYSGSTGAGARLQTHGLLAPYIATYTDNLKLAVEGMGWERFSVTVENNQWTVSRFSPGVSQGISDWIETDPWEHYQLREV